MDRIIIRTAINAIAIWVATRFVPGIAYDTVPSLVGIALIFGIVNAFLRPVLRLLTCPLIFATLGLFTFVLNAILFLLAAWIGRSVGLGFHVAGFVPAFWGALVISIVSVLLSFFFKEKDDEKRPE
ncbi:MAG: phage holin family protein [bacterium]